MVDLKWEKKQFEKWAIVTAEKREFLVAGDKIHFDWTVSHCPELVNDAKKQRGFYVWSLRDYWEGWLARAELLEDEYILSGQHKRDYDESLKPLRRALREEIPCKKCGVARKLHVGLKHKCPTK